MKRIAQADGAHSGMEARASLFGCPCHVPSPWHCLHQPGTQKAALVWCLACCPGLCTRCTAPALLWLAGHHPRGPGAAHGLCRTQGMEDGKTFPHFCSDGRALLILSHKGGQGKLAFSQSICQCLKDVQLWGNTWLRRHRIEANHRKHLLVSGSSPASSW